VIISRYASGCWGANVLRDLTGSTMCLPRSSDSTTSSGPMQPLRCSSGWPRRRTFGDFDRERRRNHGAKPVRRFANQRAGREAILTAADGTCTCDLRDLGLIRRSSPNAEHWRKRRRIGFPGAAAPPGMAYVTYAETIGVRHCAALIDRGECRPASGNPSGMASSTPHRACQHDAGVVYAPIAPRTRGFDRTHDARYLWRQ